jgi:hypothetical protein
MAAFAPDLKSTYEGEHMIFGLLSLADLAQPSSKTPPTTGVGEDVGKKEPSYTAGGNANWCNHSGKKFGGS